MAIPTGEGAALGRSARIPSEVSKVGIGQSCRELGEKKAIYRRRISRALARSDRVPQLEAIDVSEHGRGRCTASDAESFPASESWHGDA